MTAAISRKVVTNMRLPRHKNMARNDEYFKIPILRIQNYG